MPRRLSARNTNRLSGTETDPPRPPPIYPIWIQNYLHHHAPPSSPQYPSSSSVTKRKHVVDWWEKKVQESDRIAPLVYYSHSVVRYPVVEGFSNEAAVSTTPPGTPLRTAGQRSFFTLALVPRNTVFRSLGSTSFCLIFFTTSTSCTSAT